MKVFDPDTGREEDLRTTDELMRELEDTYEQCNHPSSEIRRQRVAGDAIQYRRQCLTCGAMLGTAISKTAVPTNVPDVDEALKEGWTRQRQAKRDAVKLRHLRMQQGKNSEWWRRYNAYLNTPEWRDRRRKVFARAKGLCEGCGDNAAVEVHHLTYQHVCNEFLFELVALCEPCHLRIHADDEVRE